MRGLALAAVLVSGCAAGTGAPFHVYQSPLLQAEYHPAERGMSDFDPGRVGDFHATEVQVASSTELPKPKAVTVNPSPTPEASQTVSTPKTSARPTLSATARTHVGSRPDDTGRRTESQGAWNPTEAVGYVKAVLEANGVAVTGATVADVYKSCKAGGKVRHGDPRVGDLVFFHNVFDANGDKRNNDWYTHIGIVEAADGQAARVLSYRAGQVFAFELDASRPRETADGERTINAQLREPSASDAPFTEYHAGQLFAGFCDALGDKAELVVIDGWKP